MFPSKSRSANGVNSVLSWSVYVSKTFKRHVERLLEPNDGDGRILGNCFSPFKNTATSHHITSHHRMSLVNVCQPPDW
jgi:hypothetical protein